MNIKFSTLFVLLSVLAAGFNLHAQNVTFGYQGRVLDNGVNFTGTGQFKFALVTSTNTSRQATAVANTSGGFVTIYSVVDGGAGYLVAPVVTVSGGGGSGATAVAHISGGVVTGISVGNTGSGYTSAPSVALAPPPPNIAYTSYWSNDGTSVAGSEPAHAIGLSVNGGLFTAVLGDTAQVNMAAVSAATFLRPNLQLRIWFSDGVNPFAALNPAQSLTPVPYAAFASTASNLSGTVSAAQISGPLPPANFSGVYGGAVTLNNPTNRFTGGFTGNGAGLTNLTLGSLSTAGIFTWGNFVFTSAASVGGFSDSLVAADVNGDGRMDLISANRDANTLSVMFNNGSGGFTLASSPAVGHNPYCVAAADVNGDGKVDLITVNYDDTTLSVLTNNGVGGFAVVPSPVVGPNQSFIVAADVNGDGKVDLICASFAYNTMTVLTNNGSGGFGVSSVTGAGTVRSIVVTDVNGDGKPDLVTANGYGFDSLTVWTNNGLGAFTVASVPAVGKTPVWVVAGDVNGDGKVDLICANGGTNTLSVLTNDGGGGFTLASSPIVGNYPQAVVAVDLNGDGRLDLVSANNGLSLLLNNGGGTFTVATNLTVLNSAIQVVAADFNGDGVPDLAALNAVNGFSVFLNVVSLAGSTPLNTFNAASLTSGTLADARLSANVALLNANQSFSGQNNFINANNTFTGNGGGLTSLHAANLVGTVPTFALPLIPTANLTGLIADSQLSANVALHNGFQIFSGQNTFNNPANSFRGNGSGLTSLDAGQLATGSVPDTRLSSNVPLLGATQTFTGANYFNGLVGVGNSNPQAALHVSGNIRWGNSLLTADQGGAIELGDSSQYGSTPHLDFHYGTGNSADDYNVRLANTSDGQLDIYQNGSFSPLATFNNMGLSVRGTFVSSSDRNIKENFQPVDAREVLAQVVALPITRWNYRQDQTTPHVGPMAQDFHAAFNVGADDKHIAVVDESGVALAAIQGLNQKLNEKVAEIHQLKLQNDALAERLNKLEASLNALAAKK